MLIILVVAHPRLLSAGRPFILRVSRDIGTEGTGDVLKLIVRRGLILTLTGLTIGLVTAFGVTRLRSGLLFGVGATDPLTFTAVALLLTFVALLACWIPARRATKVDPLQALRHD
jgi:putative ABC transport system permease protein